MIEAMLDVRRAICEGYARLHRVLLRVVQHDTTCRSLMTVPGGRTGRGAVVQGRGRQSVALYAVANRGRAFWLDAEAPSVRYLDRL